ncbi:acetyl-CoA hydrolase/transferase family protein [Desulforamulus hydrothermalis]|uniref:4-hydroxybutyrate coenzyme A transferase n=1 Tax=Desulforamulus hydrothermalis Lam5 = DSM 18033 TaxID=1121428 RepID=K8DXT2_9FIRM|nr:acetyl-CoA hydrolase/transferase C-terminal domain-containing protein [Desulforamulus hydrothermalis]CCO07449.1 4-hydroxybutyrate coenzyme A transferase [Desulforamulus hydrothermalis Lam5 = DSM 18033]SHH18253.1 Acyl-CoA hydrolase [Desulforamulus hydrothermalis Lam5 = DSM 18033]
MAWQNRGQVTGNPALLRDQYNAKLVTADEAVTCIQSGNDVVVAFGVAETPILLDAMVNRKDELRDVRIHQMIPMRAVKYLEPGMEEHFTHVSWFTSGASRNGVQSGRFDIMPNYFYLSPRLFAEYIEVDVLMATVSPMDKYGFFSFGTSIDYTTTVAQKAKKIILAVNPHMPRTHGNTFIHVTQADYIVEDNSPLPELPAKEPGPEDIAIGQYVAELIEDGSTLQLGIGKIPNAVARALINKKNLGIHSEILTDGMVDLIEAGAVTNNAKTIHHGKAVACAALGTKKLYNFINDNPMFELHPVSYTNNPNIIGKNIKMVSINATVEVDLLGQCASETIGPVQYSGTGGQVDFIRGAVQAPGGKAFIVLHSTVKGKSKIVPMFREGTVITTSKNDVDYVVTEYGVAKLSGRTFKQRAEALINIAHPDHRAELREAAKKMGLL